MRILALLTIFFSGCVLNVKKDDNDDVNQCQPKGIWNIQIKSKNGDCFPKVMEGSFESKITAKGAEGFDSECRAEKAESLDVDESEEWFEVSGPMIMQVRIQGDELTGTARLEGKLLESGEEIGTCTEEYVLTGKRI